MIQPFIFKYSPKNLDEFIMEDELNQLIRALIKMDNINVIFYGNSGCGKTKLINCIIKEYYSDNYNNNNVLIINSLKEQGISYYRNDVRNFCQIMCTIPNKKKIVVLDDIDTINDQSQQVFRNCIDKYSNNVHFLCSCNNIQKVIESIQSRVFIIKLNLLENSDLKIIGKNIINKENILIENDALDFIIKISNYSIRTMINYLEKFKLLEMNINYNIAKKICTNISFEDFINYTNLCQKKDLIEATKMIFKIFDDGYSVIDIFDNYFIFIKFTSSINEKEKYEIIKLLCKYITIFYNIHEDEIELALFTNNLVKIL